MWSAKRTKPLPKPNRSAWAPKSAGTIPAPAAVAKSTNSAVAGRNRSKLANGQHREYHSVWMSTVAEIEAAIEKLSAQQLAELAAWFEEYQEMTNASAEIFKMYDEEEAR